AIDAGDADAVVLIGRAVSGTAIARWQEGGDLNAELLGAVDAMSARYRATQVFWDQGEADFRIGTSGADYTARFYSLVSSLRAHGVSAPVYPAIATFCRKSPEEQINWRPDNELAQAMRALPDEARGVRAGVDTDALIPESDRFDLCHFA